MSATWKVCAHLRSHHGTINALGWPLAIAICLAASGNQIAEAARLSPLRPSGGRSLTLAPIVPVADDNPPFLVKQYNILAGYLAQNTAPWFLTHANISQTTRDKILKRFYGKDENGNYANTWEGNHFGNDSNGAPLLSKSQVAAVLEADAKLFAWDVRKSRLIREMLLDEPDILVLEELDHFEDFFEPELAKRGYKGVWAKRPRKSSDDGCGIFWKSNRFRLRANESEVFQDTDLADAVPGNAWNWDDLAHFFDAAKNGTIKTREDRIVLLAALEDQLVDDRTVLVASTHLQRNPENEDQDYTRLQELQELAYFIQRFAERHNVRIKDGSADLHLESTEPKRYVPAPDAVVLAGDFNSVRQSKSKASYTSVNDVVRMLTRGQLCNAFPGGGGLAEVEGDDGCTTATEARRMWIDYLFYSGTSLELVDVFKDPCPAGPIPNEKHPSDHMPIAVRLTWSQRGSSGVDVSSPSFQRGNRQMFCRAEPAPVQAFGQSLWPKKWPRRWS